MTTRTLIRMLVLATGAVCALGILPGAWPSLVLPALSPFLTVCSLIATRTLTVAGLIGLPAVAMALLYRRWLCRYVCPVGLLIETVGRFHTSAQGKWTKIPPLGQWVVLITLGGAFVGYPLLLWLDPFGMFNGFFSIFRIPTSSSVLIATIGLPIVLLISLVWPNLWCVRLCPLGAAQDILSLPARIARHIKSSPAESSEHPLARRSLLAMGLGAAWAAVTMKWTLNGVRRTLRPPGAIDERLFTGVCVRCGNCVRVCPTRIIKPDLCAGGVAGFLAPIVRFDTGYCEEDCNRCTQVCPSGAITRLSLAEKHRVIMGVAVVDMSHCLLSEERECNICQSRCPYEAITIGFDKHSYTQIVRIAREKCPGCGACELACPTSPKAITIRPLAPF